MIVIKFWVALNVHKLSGNQHAPSLMPKYAQSPEVIVLEYEHILDTSSYKHELLLLSCHSQNTAKGERQSQSSLRAHPDRLNP